MAVDRRKFCRLAGLGLIGMAGASTINGRAQEEAAVETAPAPEQKGIARPITGKRWAMVVDIKACREQEGCNKCQEACHATHNVPNFPDEKDEIKWIWREPYGEVFPGQGHEYMVHDPHNDKVLIFCNHCDNPPCTRVCPTQATWRREEDGIVMMDFHRCIGCRYCMAACPYGSRSFNWRDPRPFIDNVDPEYPTRTRGVVEKCTFCDTRLAKGQMPSCVEACEHGCLVFGDLEDPDSPVRELLRTRHSIRRKPGLGTQPEVYYLV